MRPLVAATPSRPRTVLEASALKPSLYQTRSGVFALATLCCILWGSAYPAIKNGYALLHIAPDDIASQMLFAGWRFALAGLILLVVAAVMKKSILGLSVRQVGQVAIQPGGGGLRIEIQAPGQGSSWQQLGAGGLRQQANINGSFNTVRNFASLDVVLRSGLSGEDLNCNIDKLRNLRPMGY